MRIVTIEADREGEMREESLSPQPPPLCHLTLKAVLEKEYSLFITDAATEKTKFYL